jgi:hypothetical protein
VCPRQRVGALDGSIAAASSTMMTSVQSARVEIDFEDGFRDGDDGVLLVPAREKALRGPEPIGART